MKTLRTLGKCVLAFMVTISFFCAALTAAFMIPQEKIQWHQEYSSVVLEIEEEWESLGNLFGFHSEPGMLDITTDRVMMQQAVLQQIDGSPLRTALFAGGYTRYWHGYLAILRPLLVLYQIHQIRYLNTFLIMGLLFAVVMLMKHKLGLGAAIGFMISMVCAGIMTVPMSMQFVAAFVVMMLACLIVLVAYPFASRDSYILFFLITGMIINYLDFLTAPMLTLGMPLLVYMALDVRQGKGTFARGFVRGAQAAIAWGAGYALCWAAKWVIASIVLDMDVLKQVSVSASGWTRTVIPGKMTGRMDALVVNFKNYFTFHGIRSMVVPLIFVLILGICLLAFRASLRGRGAAVCMLFVCAAPYVWYMVMPHHSVEHDWFTYRLQAMTLFGIYMAMIALTNQEKLRTAVNRLTRRLKRS